MAVQKATNVTWQDGDFNGDAAVTFQDFLILANNFGIKRPVAERVIASNGPVGVLATDDFFSLHDDEFTLDGSLPEGIEDLSEL